MVRLGKAVQKALLAKGKSGKIESAREKFENLRTKLEDKPQLLDALLIVADDDTLSNLLLKQKISRKITVSRYTNFPLHLKKTAIAMGGHLLADKTALMKVQRQGVENIGRLFQAQTTYVNKTKVTHGDEESWIVATRDVVRTLHNVCQHVTVDEISGELDFSSCVYMFAKGDGKLAEMADATHLKFNYTDGLVPLSQVVTSAIQGGREVKIEKNWDMEEAMITDGDEVNVKCRKYFKDDGFSLENRIRRYQEEKEAEEAAMAAAAPVAGNGVCRKRIRRTVGDGDHSGNSVVIAKGLVKGKLFGARRKKKPSA